MCNVSTAPPVSSHGNDPFVLIFNCVCHPTAVRVLHDDELQRRRPLITTYFYVVRSKRSMMSFNGDHSKLLCKRKMKQKRWNSCLMLRTWMDGRQSRGRRNENMTWWRCDRRLIVRGFSLMNHPVAAALLASRHSMTSWLQGCHINKHAPTAPPASSISRQHTSLTTTEILLVRR